MKTLLKLLAGLLVLFALAATSALIWYLHTKQPVRQGSVPLSGLRAQVTVLYDERGVPHIRAENEEDMYRALGYVQAQDRLFQMEMLRRLAMGELAEVLGPDLLDVDKLFRTLGLRRYARRQAENMDPSSPSTKALLAYLDGINQYQDHHSAPLEFDTLGIPRRAFTAQDSIAVTGYLAYSFAQAFKSVPVMTFIRDKLGPEYLRVFDTEWHPLGVLDTAAGANPALPRNKALADRTDWAACPCFRAATPGRWLASTP